MMKRQLIESAAAFLLSVSASVETVLQTPILSPNIASPTDWIFYCPAIYYAHRLRGRGSMKLVLVMGIVFLVDVLLLVTVAHMGKDRGNPGKCLIGAFLGACFAASGLLPGACILRGWAVHILSLLLIALISYGINRQAFLKAVLFVLLHLSLGRVTAGKQGMLSMLLGAVGISLGCLLLRSKEQFVTVELTYLDKHLHIQALRDTGNTLLDPVTGQSVLVVSREVARELTGLSFQQLEDPVHTMGAIPGLRLIPYRTVGNTGFLLALRLTDVRIGNWKGSTLVAFSPQQLGSNYQALTGGIT